MENLKTVHWSDIKRFPKELNWHRCSLYPLLGQHGLQGTSDRFLISVSDVAIFHNLDEKVKRILLQKLYFLHCPKLINVFSLKVELMVLESLEIKFYGRLQKICKEDIVIEGEVEWCQRIKWEAGIKPHNIRFQYVSSSKA
ncbi:hypothetical protein ACLOJK_002721 [Asimina triloba]